VRKGDTPGIVKTTKKASKRRVITGKRRLTRSTPRVTPRNSRVTKRDRPVMVETTIRAPKRRAFNEAVKRIRKMCDISRFGKSDCQNVPQSVT
jgi:hypothetical protein